jgi:hypothetical protein
MRRAGRKPIHEKIKVSKILRGKLRRARKDAMTMCIRVLDVPFLSRCVPWMICPLDNVTLTEVSRPWAAYCTVYTVQAVGYHNNYSLNLGFPLGALQAT